MRSAVDTRGLTLIELLVVVALIGILVALLLPAIQAARAAARKTQCQNRLGQTALAVHAYHGASKHLPSHYNGTSLSYPFEEWDLLHLHSWRTALLPYVEQVPLHDSINWLSLATDPENEPVATAVIASYVCPSGASPAANLGWGWRHERRGETYSVARSDYDGLAGMWVIHEVPPDGTWDGVTKYARWGVWGTPEFDDGTVDGRMTDYRVGRFAEVTDGLSKTALLVERGGRPVRLVDGRPKVTAEDPDADYPGQVGWSASNIFNWRMQHPDVGVNHDNARGIYSEHHGGANVAMADGSVVFLSDTTEITTLATMLGRSDGER